MQKCILKGHVGDPPTYFEKQSGLAFSLACNSFADAPPVWYRIVLWKVDFEKHRKMITLIKRGSGLLVVGKIMKVDPFKKRLTGELDAKIHVFADTLEWSYGTPPWSKTGDPKENKEIRQKEQSDKEDHKYVEVPF